MVYSPLQLNKSMTVVGNVAPHQTYTATTNEWWPSYAQVPLVLQPIVSVIDKDNTGTGGNINASFANVAWKRVEQNASGVYVESPISTSDTDYELVLTGANAGRLTIKRNFEVNKPVTFRFHADYTDTRDGSIHSIDMAQPVTCTSAQEPEPVIVVDIPAVSEYDPLRSDAKRKVTLKLTDAAGEVAASKRSFAIDVLRANGSYTAYGSDITDIELSGIATDKSSFTIDQDLMGEERTLRIRATYNGKELPAVKTLKFLRAFPWIQVQKEWPRQLAIGQTTVPLSCVVQDRFGIISDKGKFCYEWSTGKNTAAGTTSFSVVGRAPTLTVPSQISDNYGMNVKVGVGDIGPSKILTDKNGKVLMGKINTGTKESPVYVDKILIVK